MNKITAAFYRGDKTFKVEETQASVPGPGEARLRIAYCGICGTDMHVFHGNMDARVGLNRVVGHEMSAVVESVGEGVSNVKPGQKVVVRPLDHCGDCPACAAGHQHICHKLKFLGLDTDGAMQELWTVPAHTLHILPDDIRMDHAALIEPLEDLTPFTFAATHSPLPGRNHCRCHVAPHPAHSVVDGSR